MTIQRGIAPDIKVFQISPTEEEKQDTVLH
jgi:hypothetical protein